MAGSDDWVDVEVTPARAAATPTSDGWEDVDVQSIASPSTPTRQGKSEPFRGRAAYVRGDDELFAALDSGAPLTNEQRARVDQLEGKEFSRAGRVMRAAPGAVATIAGQQLRGMARGTAGAIKDTIAEDFEGGAPFNAPIPSMGGIRPNAMNDVAPALNRSAQTDFEAVVDSGAKSQAAITKEATPLESNLIQGGGSGLASAAVILPSSIAIAASGGSGLAAAAPGVLALSAGAGGQRYAQLRAMGIPRDAARKSAAMLGALEGLTEAIPGASLVKHNPVAHKALEFFLTDLVGENVSNLAQIADDYRLQLRDDVTKADLLQSIEDTTIQTLAGGTVQFGISEVMQQLVQRANRLAGGRAPAQDQEDARPNAVPGEEVLGNVEPEWEDADVGAGAGGVGSAHGVDNAGAAGAGVPETSRDGMPAGEPDRGRAGEAAAAQPGAGQAGAGANGQNQVQPGDAVAPVAGSEADAGLAEEGAGAPRSEDPYLERARDIKSRMEAANAVDISSPKAVSEVVGRPVQSLSQFVRANGGIADDGGELAARDVKVKAQPGLIRKPGAKNADMDSVRQAIFEAGYFPEKADYNEISDSEIFDAIADDVNGQRRYPSDVSEHLAGIQADRHMIDGLGALGITHDMDAEAIADRMREMDSEYQFHEAEARNNTPGFDAQDDTIKELTTLSKVAGQYATQDEVDAALEAASDVEAARRLLRLIARGFDEGATNGTAKQPAAVEAAAEEGLEPAARASAPESREPAQGGEDSVPAAEERVEEDRTPPDVDIGETETGLAVDVEDEKNLSDWLADDMDPATGKNIHSEGRRRELETHLEQLQSSIAQAREYLAVPQPSTDLFGANVEHTDALNARNKKVARKLGEGRAAPPADKAPPGDMFRAASEKEKAEAAAAQTDIEQAPVADLEGDGSPADVEQAIAEGHNDATLIPGHETGTDPKGAIERYEQELIRRGWERQPGKGSNWKKGDAELFIRSQGTGSSPIVQWSSPLGEENTQRRIEEERAAEAERKKAIKLAKENPARADAAASAANDIPEPTPAQKEAGNYAKGHVSLHGLDIAIENPAGSFRWKMDTDQLGELIKQARVTKDEAHLVRAQEALRDSARIPEAFTALQRAEDELAKTNPKLSRGISKLLDKAWLSRLAADYGYIKGHIGKDKDHLDVYVDLQRLAEDPAHPIWVMDQKNPAGGFDEHKVFMGFENAKRIETDYVKSFDDADFARKIMGKLRKFESAEAFKQWLAAGDLTKPVAEWKGDVRHPAPGTESDRAVDQESGAQAAVRSGKRGREEPGTGTAVQRPDGGTAASAEQLREGVSAAAGERGDQQVRGKERGYVAPDVLAGSDEPVAGGEAGGVGLADDLFGAGDPVEAARAAAPALDRDEKRKRQRAAEGVPVTPNNRANIAKTLPFLLEGQHDDVKKAEDRFAKPDGYGMLFTNGTGTGKTYTGLGWVKRMVKAGKPNGLITVPSQKIADDWIKSGQDLGLTINVLESTQDAGKGIVITTYANFGANRHLADRTWDWTISDEAHSLMQNEAAEDTASLDALRAITLHPDGVYRRAQMLHRAEWDEVERLGNEIAALEANDMPVPEALEAKHTRALEVFDEARKRVAQDVAKRQGAARPRSMFLTATPFAYEKNVKWANGYLFQFDNSKSREEKGGLAYNEPGAYESFMVQHFGYRMRYNKLTEPDAQVDRTIMQRQFNTWMRQEGALSARILEEPYDYDRKFVLIDSKVGNKIDEGLKWLREQKDLHELEQAIHKRFDFLSRSRLLEALKAREAVDYIKAQHKLGRKVVVFYDFNEGGGFDVFDVNTSMIPPGIDEGTRQNLIGQITRFREMRPDLVALNTKAPSPLETLTKAFPNAKQYNGLVPAKKRTVFVNGFNADELPQENLILAQKAANAGWSAHDTTGKHSRVLINLGLPTAPTVAIQQEGRIYRVGQRSDAMFRYFNTGTNWERYAFATTIARRASTAENLAMGEQARGLRDSFIQAFEDSAPETPGGPEDGKGGKAKDRELASALSEFDRAKTFYFANLKKNSRTKAAEGVDYFATPEPLGLKMVEWARPKPNDDLLEPSAGHGAIARFFPELQNRTVVEPSAELASRLALATNAKLIQQDFEKLDPHNKYDVIVMNPPFGHGASTAMKHLDQAFTKHLRDGGRIVALIPEGSSSAVKFSNWYENTQGVYKVAEYSLPNVVFERAGTNVKTRVLVLDKMSDDFRKYNKGEVANETGARDIDAKDINEFFDKIQDMESPPRVRDVRMEEIQAASDQYAAREEAKKAQKEEKKAAKASGKAFTAVDGKHTKKGTDIYYAVPVARADGGTYAQWKADATKLGGYYSSWGATKGFLFEDKASRDAFMAKWNGAPVEEPSFAVNESPAPKGWETVEGGTRVAKTGKPRTAISKDALAAHIKKIAESLPLVEVHAAHGWDGIKADDRGLLEQAHKWNIPADRWGGVAWTRPNGKKVIYLNALGLDSLAHAEQILFHEAYHRGVKAALGNANYQRLVDFLFIQQGGARAFPRENRLYFEQMGEPFDVNNPVHRMRLVDEALAHLAQFIKRGDSLPARFEKLLDGLLAWINRFLRERGWRRTFAKSEIKEMVRNASELGLTMTRRDDTVETPAREMASFAARAMNETQRRRAAIKVDEKDEAAMALRDDDEALANRQNALWNSLKKGQYIERAIRLAFMPPGLTTNEKGEWTLSPLGKRVAAKVRDSSMRAARRSFQFLRPLHDSVNRQYQVDEKVKNAIAAVKSGLVDRWGTPPEFVLADYAAQNYKTQILDRAKKMVEDLEASGIVTNRAEAEALQALWTSTDPADVEAKMAAIPEPMRQLIDQFGAESVELGMLDRATYERNKGAYLHRAYRKHEADWLGVSGAVKAVDNALTSRRRKIIGNQFKRRGISFDVSVENLRKALPSDWWGRKVGGKKLDVALGESDWVVLSKVVNPREGTPDAFTGDTKGRDAVVARAYWPADQEIPAKFAGWRNDGTFRAIKVTPNSVTLWRDFSKEERTRMGEILDARYTFLKTALTAAHDLATGRLFRDIARNPEWSRDVGPTTDDGTPLWGEAHPGRRKYNVEKEWTLVPDTSIPGTNVKRYGQMAGKYIRSSIWRDLNELEMGLKPGVWKTILTQFKKNKTTRNPKTHFFNTMSNVILAYIDDMRASDWVKGVREWASNGPMWEEARLHGVFGHDFVEQEVKRDVLRPMLERIIKESNAEGAEGQKLKLLTKLFSGIRTLDEKATWMYQAEDELFRMASYMQARKQGMSPDEAAIHARKQFIDYDIRAPWINALRYSVIPFISYTYRAIPRVMDAVAKRPWKIATLALLTYLVNEIAYQLVGDADEDEERRLMNEHARGHTWAFTPRMIRLPMNDEYENPVFLDMRNGLPAANIVDFENSNSAVPTPAWMQIGGPLIAGVDFMQNYDAYRQEPIADSEVDTVAQKAQKSAKFLWSNYMPAWAPGGYHWDRVAGALQGRMNQAHETSTIGMAVAQAFLPITVQSTEKNRRDRIREYERKLRALGEQAADLRHDFQKIKDPSNDDVADLREALAEIQSRRDQVVRERAATLHGEKEE